MRKTAFSIVETLLVLCIVAMTWMLFAHIPRQEWQYQIISRLFFDQIAAEMHLMQQRAILTQIPQTIQVDAEQSTITFADVTYTFPEGWYVMQPYQMTYLSSGRVRQFQTMRFFHENGNQVAFVFQLGSGKFEVQTIKGD